MAAQSELTKNAALLSQQSLERLAKERGDITAEVIARYYREHPDSRRSFIDHGLDDVAGLEGRMVTETLYLLMQWIENQQAERISQATTIVHHNDTLQIGPRWYMGLIDAVLEVLLETIPQENHEERAIWIEARAQIAAFIDGLRDEFWRKDESGPLPDFKIR